MTSMIYEFRVDGRLPEHGREAFCGLHLEEVPAGLVLRGPVIDESHLLGIISELGMLGLSLVSVRPAGRPGHAAPPGGRPVGDRALDPPRRASPPASAAMSDRTSRGT